MNREEERKLEEHWKYLILIPILLVLNAIFMEFLAPGLFEYCWNLLVSQVGEIEVPDLWR